MALPLEVGFWVGFMAGIFILMHIPSCDWHWAARIRPLSNILKKHHRLTLNLATFFAIAHMVLALLQLATGVRI